MLLLTNLTKARVSSLNLQQSEISPLIGVPVTRPVTSLAHQAGRRVSESGPNFLNYVQRIFPGYGPGNSDYSGLVKSNIKYSIQLQVLHKLQTTRRKYFKSWGMLGERDWTAGFFRCLSALNVTCIDMFVCANKRNSTTLFWFFGI